MALLCSILWLTRLELPHSALCQLGFAPTSSSCPGGTLPSLPALFGDILFPSQATPQGYCKSKESFLAALPFRHTWGASYPPNPALQTPCMPAQPGHSTAPPAKPQPQAGAGWVNVFPITSHWPLVLWKKTNHLVIIFL